MRRKRHADSTTTLSDDDDDDDDASMSFERLKSFMPRSNDDEEEESVMPIRADDATISLGGGDVDAPPPLPPARAEFAQVVDPKQAQRFVRAPAAVLIKDATPPSPLDVAPKYVTWARRRVATHKKLTEEPWYRMALLTASYAGISIDDIVHIPSLAPPKKQRSFGGGSMSILDRLVAADPEPERQPIAVSNPPPDEQSGGKEEDARTMPGAPTTKVKMTSFLPSGMSETYNALAATFQGDVRDAFQHGVTPERLAELKRQEAALAVLRRVETSVAGPNLDDPNVTGLVFTNPAYPANQILARDMIRTRYPQTLRDVTVEQFEQSKTCGSFFALIAASLLSRGYFVAGRRILRASDYKRYEEGVAHGMMQMRFAVIVGASVELQYNDIADFRNAAAARAPACHGSLLYATTPYRSSPQPHVAAPPPPPRLMFGRR